MKQFGILNSALILALTLVVLFYYQSCGNPSQTPTTRSFASNSPSPGSPQPSPTPTGPVPAAPQMLVGQSASSEQIDLVWSNTGSTETGIKIERAPPGGGPFSPSGGPGLFNTVATLGAGVQAYSNIGLSPATKYYYRVRATNSNGDSQPSNVVEVVTAAAPLGPPNAPSLLSATATAATLIDLTWKDNSTNESYFQIERSADGGTTFKQISVSSANQKTFRDINLNPQTTYVYRVRATNSAGSSAYTTTASATTMAAGNVNTYAYISVNIIGPNCVDCHSASLPSGGFRYDTYATVMQSVSAGNANGSRLYTVTANNGRMPPGAPLTQSQVTAIQTWINSGAQNN